MHGLGVLPKQHFFGLLIHGRRTVDGLGQCIGLLRGWPLLNLFKPGFQVREIMQVLALPFMLYRCEEVSAVLCRAEHIASQDP